MEKINFNILSELLENFLSPFNNKLPECAYNSAGRVSYEDLLVPFCYKDSDFQGRIEFRSRIEDSENYGKEMNILIPNNSEWVNNIRHINGNKIFFIIDLEKDLSIIKIIENYFQGTEFKEILNPEISCNIRTKTFRISVKHNENLLNIYYYPKNHIYSKGIEEDFMASHMTHEACIENVITYFEKIITCGHIPHKSIDDWKNLLEINDIKSCIVDILAYSDTNDMHMREFITIGGKFIIKNWDYSSLKRNDDDNKDYEPLSFIVSSNLDNEIIIDLRCHVYNNFITFVNSKTILYD